MSPSCMRLFDQDDYTSVESYRLASRDDVSDYGLVEHRALADRPLIRLDQTSLLLR
jgi:hypothetical protein